MSFVAISKVKYPDSVKEEVHELGLKMLPVAKRQPGLLTVGFFQACDINETMMYWEWESKADHEACMASEEWVEVMGQSKELFDIKGVEFSLETFERLG